MTEPPAPAALLLDFANTVDIEEGTDSIASYEGWRAWLAARRPDRPTGRREHEQALALRAGLRARLLATNGGEVDAAALDRAHAVLDALPLPVRLDTGTPLAATDTVGEIAAAWVAVAAGGDWPRLKQCPNHECGWVFWDATRSRTRRWCSMRVCGNRAKVRAYATRRQA
ncbi:hypothetical protein Sru01_14160 [Sphaerisporangium rufum]|uniref:Zinc finger CGNR domain-containing protein n=1 Tax=Sphaerisporangium rufum TaxID=1381558 RepID=A0A919QYD6_9ACTN|nr:CGNR zinc finger domain-containing protein [Sphaerisporangium rufum]GII76434.1 hypothetical protein Sru01_14160 [Sphaerisporangium rufum]